MNIYVEVMTIYGITFLVSMFVALIIWVMAKLVDSSPGNSFSLKEFVADFLQRLKSVKAEREKSSKQFRETKVGESNELNKYHHERA